MFFSKIENVFGYYIFFYNLGFDISNRKKKTASIGASHLISKEESMKWFQTKVIFFHQTKLIVIRF